MNIVIPMAGRGSRFAAEGQVLPKPLIPVLGRPMYTWALDSLPAHKAKQIFFICLAEHLEKHELAQDIASRLPPGRFKIIPVESVTQGQACTVLLASRDIDSTTPLLIFNADTYCENGFETFLHANPGIEGALGVFSAPGEHWSFARVDDLGRVVETAEKRRISPWASTGLYYFSKGADFVRYANEMIADNERVNGEFYVAPIYNRLVAQGRDIRIYKTNWVHSLGTPEELRGFLNLHRGKLRDAG